MKCGWALRFTRRGAGAGAGVCVLLAVFPEVAARKALSPAHSLARAHQIASADSARLAYESIATRKTAPDSVRAEAYRRMGDYWLIASLPDSAAAAYQRSLSLAELEAAIVGSARAHLARGRPEAAIAILVERESFGPRSDVRDLLHAHALWQAGRSDDARRLFVRAGESENESVRAAALAARIQISFERGDSANGAALVDVMRERYGESLSAAALDATMGRPRSEAFTVQAGAFASADNAAALHKKLVSRFDNVRVVVERVNGALFHKVHVGSFADEQRAKSFAERSLTPAGYSWRVIATGD
jgi:tetratricopeptide (TPR) repeat protein